MTVFWLRAVRILAAALVCLFSAFRSSVSAQRVYGRSPQVNRVVGYPGSTSYSLNEYSSEFQTFSNSYPSVNYEYGGSTQYSGGNALPTFQFLSNSGIVITVPGPYPESESYQLKFYININRDFNGVKRGNYEGDASFPVGTTWTYTFPNIQLRQSDTIYYWVVAMGSLGVRTWFREYKGFYSVPLLNPHGKPGTSYKPQSAPIFPSQPLPPYQPPKPQNPPYQPQPAPTYPQYQPNPPYRPQPSTKPSFYQPETKPKPQPPPQITGSIDLSEYAGSNPISEKGETCRRSTLSVFNNGNAACAGQPIVDRLEFEAVAQIAGYEPEEKFTVFLKDNLLKNGSLTAFVPSLLEERFGAGHKDKSISLPDCTSRMAELCSALANGYLILPPVIAARGTTEKSLSFRYGILEVTAKLPRGDWIVPELWLLPKNRVYGNSSGRIVLAMSRGNNRLSDGSKDYSSRTLEAGVEFGDKDQMFSKIQNQPWHNGYHTFKLIWTPELMQFFVDNKEIGRVQPGRRKLDPSLGGSNLAPFDQEFYLAFGIHVGGDKDFPDIPEKPWTKNDPKNKLNFWLAQEKWHRTWIPEQAAMYISRISLTALNQ